MENGSTFTGLAERAVTHVREIIRSELDLLKQELKEKASKAGKSAITLAVGAVLLVYAAGLVIATCTAALALFLPVWAAALCMAFVVGVPGAIAVAVGLHHIKKVKPKPERTIRSIKESAQWARQQIR